MAIKQAYRITKYNPTMRAPDGTYRPDEWTSVSDIGKQFPTGEFTCVQYLAMERKYVDAALHVWELAQRPPLIVSSLETNAIKFAKRRLAHLPELLDVINEVPSNKQVLQDVELVARTIKAVLRELIWCKLEAKKNLYFHFGWDYYMYCGGVDLDSEAGCRIAEYGLFVERFKSPY